jgi:ankyrin repeat protein
MNSPKDIEAFYNAVDINDIETIVDLVTAKKVDVNHRFENHDSKTATHIAAARRDLTLLKVLVDDLCSDLDVNDIFEQVPVENAACHHNYAAIKFLLSRKSEHVDKVQDHVNASEVDEFFDAVQANDLEKVRKILLTGKVDVDSPNKTDFYNTALHTACDNTNFEMVKLLVNEFNADMCTENNSEEIPVHLTDDENIVEFLKSKNNE